MSDKYLTLGELREALARITLPDDTLVLNYVAEQDYWAPAQEPEVRTDLVCEIIGRGAKGPIRSFDRGEGGKPVVVL